MSELLAVSHSHNTWLQACDPRLRVLLTLLIALTTVQIDSLTILTAMLTAIVVLAINIRLPLAQMLKRLLAFESFMLLVLIFVPFSLEGKTLFAMGPLAASIEGIERAITIILRANIVMLALMSILGTMEPEVLGHSLARLKLPEKLVHLLLMTVRYISVVFDEYRRLRQAMRARAFVASSNRHSWRSLGWLIGMLLIRSLERSQRVLGAMKCRGFQGRLYLLHNNEWQTKDSLILAFTTVVLCCLLLMDILP